MRTLILTLGLAAIAAVAVISAFVTLSLGLIATWRALGHKAAPLLRND